MYAPVKVQKRPEKNVRTLMCLNARTTMKRRKVDIMKEDDNRIEDGEYWTERSIGVTLNGIGLIFGAIFLGFSELYAASFMLLLATIGFMIFTYYERRFLDGLVKAENDRIRERYRRSKVDD